MDESSPVTLKIIFQAGLSAQEYKFLRFESTDSVRSVLQTICERSNIFFSSDFGLYLPPEDSNTGGNWLHEDRTLQSYELQNQVQVEFKCRPRTIKFLVDETKTLVPLVVDYTSTVASVVAILCEQLKIKNADDYFIQDGLYQLDLNKSLRMQFTADQTGNLVLKKKTKLKDRKSKLKIFGSEAKELNVFAPTMFGVPIQQALLYSGQRASIPIVVSKSIDWIEMNGLDVEGIFRLSGSASEIESYKESFNRGVSFDFPETADPHAVAGLLKMYFRELPEPVIPFNLYNGFIEAQEISLEHFDTRLKCFASLVTLLPMPNRVLLQKLIRLLSVLVSHRERNKMAAPNLAIVFAQNIFRDQDGGLASVVRDTAVLNSITKVLIENFEFIFKCPEELPMVATACESVEPKVMGWIHIQTNDFLFVVTSSGGFCTGFCHGQMGLFPETCVSYWKQESPTIIPQTPASEKMGQFSDSPFTRSSRSLSVRSTESTDSTVDTVSTAKVEKQIYSILDAVKEKFEAERHLRIKAQEEAENLKSQLKLEQESKIRLGKEVENLRQQLLALQTNAVQES